MHIRTLLFALVVLLFVQPGTAQNAPPATIRVADGCTLADAIRAANTAAAVGACSAGSGGRDLIVLTENVELTARAEGLNGLPVIRSEITLRGGGYVIERSTASGTPPFRLLEIAPEGRLSLENVMLRGGRLTGEQLVAVRAGSHENAGFQLGRVDWIFVAGVREFLIAGIHILPGAPVAVVLCNPAHGAIKVQHFRGFCLPAIEGLGEVASVLTPEGWFRAGHLIEIRTDAMRQIRLTRLIERGADFDRCAFEYV